MQCGQTDKLTATMIRTICNDLISTKFFTFCAHYSTTRVPVYCQPAHH